MSDIPTVWKIVDGVRRVVVPIQKDVILAYLGTIQRHPNMDRLKATSTVISVGSAIGDLYKERGKIMPDDVKQAMSLENGVLGHENDNDNGNDELRANLLFDTWTWGGRLLPNPETFQFPSSSVADLWDLWFHGHPGLRIRPFKCIRKFDLRDKKCQIQLVKARKVINIVVALAHFEDQTPASSVAISDLPPADSHRLFESGFSVLLDKIEEKEAGAGKLVNAHRRVGELRYTTVYADLQQYKIMVD